MNFPDFQEVIKRKHTKSWIRCYYHDFYCFLNTSYKNISWGERLYRFYNNIEEAPLCPICSKPLSFLDIKQGYRKYCSTRCAHKDPSYLNGIKTSLMSKYGVSNIAKLSEIQEKIKLTKLELYGNKNYNNREKSKKTCIEKYGVDNFSKTLTKDVEDYLEVDGEFKYKCPHQECSKCVEKYYLCSRELHNSRKEFKVEMCTRLLPHHKENNKGSSIELFVRGILDEYNIEYYENERSILEGRELDIYIPSKNIAIECNGVYWHSKLDKYYHQSKFIECAKKNIQLISVWEDQIKRTPQIVKSLILSKLNIYKLRIYARNCIVKEISQKESSNFLTSNHLQGASNGSVRLGLYYNEELVSIMVLGRGRKSLNSRDEWEMYRFCNKTNTCVIGAAGKLLSYFKKHYKPCSIVSFSSNDISNGDVYKKLGFSKVSSSISYWYIKNYKRYHRFNFTKKSLSNKGYDTTLLSEEEIMKESRYFKIYDSGQTKWKLDMI